MTDVLPAYPGLDPGRHRHAGPRTGRRQQFQDLWSGASPRTRTSIQLATLVVVVGTAYNYSLTTLLQSAGQDTPLAYVSLVPAIALAWPPSGPGRSSRSRPSTTGMSTTPSAFP